MQKEVDVVCLVSVMATRLVHPATFRFVRDAEGKLKQDGNGVVVEWIDSHPEGFTDPQVALRWIDETGVLARYRGPGFNVALRQNMTGSRSFKMDELEACGTREAQLA